MITRPGFFAGIALILAWILYVAAILYDQVLECVPELFIGTLVITGVIAALVDAARGTQGGDPYDPPET